jgi:hypothetical protein
MRLWGVRDSCGWCLYRVQGCVVIVAIFCPCGDVKPHLRLRIGGSWWVERTVSACVPKDPYARDADTWVSSLEYTVAVVRSLAFQYKTRCPIQARTNSQEHFSIRRDGSNDDSYLLFSRVHVPVDRKWHEQPTLVVPCRRWHFSLSTASLCSYKAGVQTVKSATQCVHPDCFYIRT